MGFVVHDAELKLLQYLFWIQQKTQFSGKRFQHKVIELNHGFQCETEDDCQHICGNVHK